MRFFPVRIYMQTKNVIITCNLKPTTSKEQEEGTPRTWVKAARERKWVSLSKNMVEMNENNDA
jgi:hypothetical protein